MSVNIYNSNPNATSEEENFSCVADRGSKLASDTIYSNTTSGLNSVNVQGAIDEVNKKVEDNANAISQINSDLTNIGNNKQDKTDKALKTNARTIVGAINELKNRLIIDIKYIESNVNNIAPQGFTQVRLLHGLDASKVTGITPYFNGNAMGGITNCHLDGKYVEMNISNYSSNQTISGVAGAIIYYHN